MYRMIGLISLLFILWANIAFAQNPNSFSPSPTIQLQDEGTTQGNVKKLNCVGTSVTCTVSGITGTVTVTGGSGSANVVEVTVDFGATGNTTAKTVVTGQAWVTTTSVIVCSPTMMATADRIDGMEDAIIEGLTVAAYARVNATGFTVAANPAKGLAFKKFLIHCTGA